MRKFARPVTIALLGAAVACNILIGLRDDYGLVTDAASDGGIDAAIDAAIDAESKDGPGDAPFMFTNPCKSGASHTLCCDFDGDGAVVVGCWFPVTKVGNVSISGAQYVSASKSMYATTKVVDGGDWAYGKATLDGGKSKATCTLDAYLDVIVSSGTSFMGIHQSNDDKIGVQIVLGPVPDGGPAVEARYYGSFGDGSVNGIGVMILPIHTWFRLQLELDLPGNQAGTATLRALSYDAGPPLQFTTNIFSVLPAFGFRAGVLYVPPDAAAGVFVDNVVCDTQ